jgi:murein DD-endopeptidase MepM/ murein hydrolase activator NlpD
MRSVDRLDSVRSWAILATVIALMTVRAEAQDGLAVLGPGEAPRTMLYRALEQQARERLDARRKEVAELKTPEAIRARQKAIRARFLEALGDLPEKSPLNARVVGVDRRDGYRVERVIYESRPAHYVTAALYVPDGEPPFPGVLVPCGHDKDGKAAEAYQRACILLARNGMAVLCYDPIGQGERLQALDDRGQALIAGSTTEHTMAGIGALLVGRSAAGYRFWDGVRSLDYLAGRPEVDPSRLGCTGNSGGGTMTAYLMALDDRIAAAAPSCYLTSLARLFATIGPQDAEQNITGQVAFGMDHADYATLRAPKPTLFCVGTRDFFDIQGSWDTFREVKGIYGRLGFGERVDLFESDETHGFTKPRREAAMRWLRRWLVKVDDAPVEADVPVATEALLRCTRTGQVLTDSPGSKSVFDLNAERADALKARRAERSAGRSPEALRDEVRKRLALTGPQSILVDNHRTIRREGYTIDLWTLGTEPGIQVVDRLFRPDEPVEGKPMVVYVGADRSLAAPGGPIERRVKDGQMVAMIEPRGMGETAPVDARQAGLAGADGKEAYLGLHLNRPLLEQRVYDLIHSFRALARTDDPTSGFHLVGIGLGGPIALHAAALDERFKSVEIEGSLISWDAVARTPVSRGQLSSVIPGVLESYDLPDLATLIAPRPLTIRAAVDPAGRPVSQDRIDATYAPARASYRDRGAEAALTLKAGPPPPARSPLVRAVDLSVGETAKVELADGSSATVKLTGVDERRDPIRSAVREARVRVEVNGAAVSLSSGNYSLPVSAGGVQVDCPVTGGYNGNTNQDSWGLVKDARIRLWPARSPWVEPTAFRYPARQRWFASSTQMANEPTYVDGGETPSVQKIYYHNGLDIGGAEGMVEVVAATDGVVVSAGTAVMDGFKDTPARPRYDVVYVLDDQGWYYRYSHLQTIDPAIQPGAAVRMGQKVGVLGKEGASGGWSHLHFEITSRQPSGRWGTQEGYAFLWQSYQREHRPEVVAVARPHHLIWAGEAAVLDGAKSWSRSGPIASFEWTFGDGTTATGPRVERTYDRPGAYSEVLKVTDRNGHIDYDFAIVQVLDRANLDRVPPTVHAAYAPTTGIGPGDPVTFKVRTFGTTDGRETWDFGDGTPPVVVRSDGNVDRHARDGYATTVHRFEKPGHYMVRVERSNAAGATATARLLVVVEGDRAGSSSGRR